MLNLMAGFLLSFLPQRWRRGLGLYEGDLTRGALISGLVEMLGFVALLIVRYYYFTQNRLGGPGSMLYSFRFGAGIFLVVEYFCDPFTWVLIYFAIEGLGRFGTAVVSSEVVATLPLALIAMVEERFSKAAAERAMGERVPDEVQQVVEMTGALRILSCRPKERWNNLMTISYDDKLYEVAEQQEGAAPRRFVYLLRPKPEGKIVRGLYQYDPEEVVRSK